MTLRVCQMCPEKFYATAAQVKRGKGRFCSKKCVNDWMRLTRTASPIAIPRPQKPKEGYFRPYLSTPQIIERLRVGFQGWKTANQYSEYATGSRDWLKGVVFGFGLAINLVAQCHKENLEHQQNLRDGKFPPSLKKA